MVKIYKIILKIDCIRISTDYLKNIAVFPLIMYLVRLFSHFGCLRITLVNVSCPKLLSNNVFNWRPFRRRPFWRRPFLGDAIFGRLSYRWLFPGRPFHSYLSKTSKWMVCIFFWGGRGGQIVSHNFFLVIQGVKINA